MSPVGAASAAAGDTWGMQPVQSLAMTQTVLIFPPKNNKKNCFVPFICTENKNTSGPSPTEALWKPASFKLLMKEVRRGAPRHQSQGNAGNADGTGLLDLCQHQQLIQMGFKVVKIQQTIKYTEDRSW